MLEKAEIRKMMKQRLHSIHRLEYEQKSFEGAQRLYETCQWKQAQTIGITISHVPEIDTWQLIRKAWIEGKTVCVPKCHHDSRRLDFYAIESFEQLENKYLHLFEPNPVQTNAMNKEKISLLVVPGLAYSIKGFRIGFGGGYYDRFLKDYQGETISLAFQEQILANIPKDKYDLPVQKLITPAKVYLCE
ncbi:5-formyltetrahydrofolate cyclo-ligase [Bacillus sp. 2205SS5-2]|uniref:5-formyltetrahydrofolate cyclo-ligase n=1 Tax=Bacillus sp. 2205SS5-2 TaxID=3109031 RepID=UPI003007B57F